MNFADAWKILEGREGAVSRYFRDKKSARLHEIFRLIVHDSMAEVGVIRYCQELDQKASSMPFVGNYWFDLDEYLINGALGGLFSMVAREEKKIWQHSMGGNG